VEWILNWDFDQLNSIQYIIKGTVMFSRVFFLLSLISFSAAAQPSPPSSIKYSGYPMHISIEWKFNAAENITSFKVYSKSNDQYSLKATLAKDQPFYDEWIGDTNQTKIYAVTCVNNLSQESVKSSDISIMTQSVSDSVLLDMVQKTSFRYFWNYSHPTSGLARERHGSGNTVTTGGSGFGIMTIPVAVERGWITYEEGVAQVLKIASFLKNKANRFHGVWPHWLNGETGSVIPFSTNDNGGDLVESSFMLQGLLAVRQYFSGSTGNELLLQLYIKQLWEGAEFDWYRQTPSSNYLYWHWSPDKAWIMNFQLKGWNETMICYLLGIASPTHPIPASMYKGGWASGTYLNGKFFYGKKLYIGSDWGGPLFFTHYSFLGFDPRGKQDGIINSGTGNSKVTYFDNFVNTSLIHNKYAIDNPKKFTGYSAECWGLTASDNPWGYNAQEPQNNDNGTITPTAALSAFPYTPTESMNALKHFYFKQGEKLWGIYGFKDAFNLKENWFASSYLAIDQGPIIVMIENYRSQLLWKLFMKNPEITTMMTAIGMKDITTSVENKADELISKLSIISAYPNPFNPSTTVTFQVSKPVEVIYDIFNIEGQNIYSESEQILQSGIHTFSWKSNLQSQSISSGTYLLRIRAGNEIKSIKLILLK